MSQDEHPHAGKLEPATAAKYAKNPIYEGVLARFPLALAEVSRVSVFGAGKHNKPISDNSFLEVPDAYRVYTNCVARHLLDEVKDGPVNQGDGGMLHAAQLAWNALARLEVFLRAKQALLDVEK